MSSKGRIKVVGIIINDWMKTIIQRLKTLSQSRGALLHQNTALPHCCGKNATIQRVDFKQ